MCVCVCVYVCVCVCRVCECVHIQGQQTLTTQTLTQADYPMNPHLKWCLPPLAALLQCLHGLAAADAAGVLGPLQVCVCVCVCHIACACAYVWTRMALCVIG